MIISFVSIYFNSCVMQLMLACCQVFMHIGAFNVKRNRKSTCY